MKRLSGVLFLLVALSTMTVAGTSSGVTWSLSGVQFNDGGTASGSFVYDSATNTFSSINITTTTGSSASGGHYIAIHPGVVQESSHIRVLTAASGDLSNTPYLAISLTSAMTNSGGIIAMIPDGPATYSEFQCANSGCTATGQLRKLTAGSITANNPNATSVPTLTETGMLMAALLLMACAWLALRKRAEHCA